MTDLPKAVIPNQFNLMEMELIHHFLTWTCHTLWHRPARKTIWVDTIFKTALEYPPLLNAVLATAATHKITLLRGADTVPRYTAVALSRRADAFSAFMPLVSNPTPDKAVAIFGFTSMISIWAYASSNLPASLDLLGQSIKDPKLSFDALQQEHSPLFRFLQFVTLVSGTTATMRRIRGWLENTAVREMVARPNLEPHPFVSHHAEEALHQLSLQMQNESSTRVMLGSQCPYVPLRALLHVLSCPDHFNILVVWPLTLPPSFINSLYYRHPGALTVLAYWVACLHTFDNWWTNGWGYDLVYEIVGTVDSSWTKALDWPRSVVDSGKRSVL